MRTYLQKLDQFLRTNPFYSMKTLQEAKDEIARTIYDCKDWQDFREDGRDWRVYEDAHDLVAELLAKEACREQREICAAHYNHYTKDTDLSILFKIKNAPEPKMI